MWCNAHPAAAGGPGGGAPQKDGEVLGGPAQGRKGLGVPCTRTERTRGALHKDEEGAPHWGNPPFQKGKPWAHLSSGSEDCFLPRAGLGGFEKRFSKSMPALRAFLPPDLHCTTRRGCRSSAPRTRSESRAGAAPHSAIAHARPRVARALRRRPVLLDAVSFL